MIAATLLTVSFAIVTTALVLSVVLATEPRTLDDQPFPDSHEYADAAEYIALKAAMDSAD